MEWSALAQGARPSGPTCLHFGPPGSARLARLAGGPVRLIESAAIGRRPKRKSDFHPGGSFAGSPARLQVLEGASKGEEMGGKTWLNPLKTSSSRSRLAGTNLAARDGRPRKVLMRRRRRRRRRRQLSSAGYSSGRLGYN